MRVAILAHRLLRVRPLEQHSAPGRQAAVVVTNRECRTPPLQNPESHAYDTYYLQFSGLDALI